MSQEPVQERRRVHAGVAFVQRDRHAQDQQHPCEQRQQCTGGVRILPLQRRLCQSAGNIVQLWVAGSAGKVLIQKIACVSACIRMPKAQAELPSPPAQQDRKHRRRGRLSNLRSFTSFRIAGTSPAQIAMQRTFFLRKLTATTMKKSTDEALWTLIRRIRFARLYWDTRAGKRIQLLAMAKAVATDARPQVGVHQGAR